MRPNGAAKRGGGTEDHQTPRPELVEGGREKEEQAGGEGPSLITKRYGGLGEREQTHAYRDQPDVPSWCPWRHELSQRDHADQGGKKECPDGQSRLWPMNFEGASSGQ